MANFFTIVFGVGKDLTAPQMCSRGVVVFLLALVLIRLSGRRSFGLRSPLDNIISILMGAILSRAVVGASPFLPIVVTCFMLALMHRAFSWLASGNTAFGNFTRGKRYCFLNKANLLKNILIAFSCAARM